MLLTRSVWNIYTYFTCELSIWAFAVACKKKKRKIAQKRFNFGILFIVFEHIFPAYISSNQRKRRRLLSSPFQLWYFLFAFFSVLLQWGKKYINFINPWISIRWVLTFGRPAKILASIQPAPGRTYAFLINENNKSTIFWTKIWKKFENLITNRGRVQKNIFKWVLTNISKAWNVRSLKALIRILAQTLVNLIIKTHSFHYQVIIFFSSLYLRSDIYNALIKKYWSSFFFGNF